MFHVPPQLVLLGSALAPVAKGLQRELRRRVRSSGRVFEVPEDLTRHLGLLETALSHLEPRPARESLSLIEPSTGLLGVAIGQQVQRASGLSSHA